MFTAHLQDMRSVHISDHGPCMINVVCFQHVANMQHAHQLHMLILACLQSESGESTSEAEQRVTAAEVALDRCLLKLFNTAVRGDKLQQALEAACQLTQVRSMEGAIKLANHNRQTALADRIALLLEARLEQEAAEAADQVQPIVMTAFVT